MINDADCARKKKVSTGGKPSDVSTIKVIYLLKFTRQLPKEKVIMMKSTFS